MSGRPVKYFQVTIASAVTFSSAIDLQQAYNKVSIVLPSMPSGTDVRLHVSETLDGTYRSLFHQPTVTSAAVSFTIASSISNCVVPIPNLHAQYVKIELSSATTSVGGNAYTYSFICAD